MVKKKRSFQEVTATPEPAVLEQAPSGNGLRAALEEVKTYDGVIGYILRNSTSAAIDLRDPTRIIDYAILSSSALDAGKELSMLFNLGEVKNILLEGKEAKVLSLTIGENRVSVFMEKNADCEKLLRKLNSAVE
jgi:predicted regulator of Ras-like GTPase activity (Roadblock/LC7/MglB family)